MRAKRNSTTRSTNTGTLRNASVRSPQRDQAAFTLLEIMVAVTIFGILTIAVYSTFRMGLKSYESGREQMVVTQTARVIFDLFSRELRALYYLPPNQYNTNLIRLQQMRAMNQIQEDPMRKAWRFRRQRLAARGNPDAAGEDEESLPGIPINLTIVGSDQEGFDSLTFVCYQVNWGTAEVQPWALARVKYFVKDGNLFRAEGPIAVDDVPSFQWQPPPSPDAEDRRDPDEPDESNTTDGYLRDAPRELVARNVKKFDLLYGYWGEDGWFESSDWVAHERRYRNPLEEIDPLDPNAQMLAAFQNARPTDDIPAYVTLTLELGYGKENEKARLFRSRIRLLNSTETYQPFLDPAVLAPMARPNTTMRTPRATPPMIVPPGRR